jgi:putative endonuclease
MGIKEIAVLTGGEAERCAEEFLKQHCLVLLQRNYRCRFGEIDLIMRDGAALVFVEVRLRATAFFGGAASSITVSKQERIIRTARHYLGSLRAEPSCRFDAVVLSGREGGQIEWIKDAFGE